MSTHDVRVVVTRKMPAAVEAEIASRYDALFNRTDVALTAEQMAQVLQQADVVVTTVTDKWHPGIFDTTSIRTKLLANVGVGVNHIALEAARRAGIAVSNTPDVVTDDTADVAIALMLMTMRRLGEGERHLRSGAWGGLRPTFMLGRTLRGKTLGIVGYGRIGRAVARIAHDAFGMHILWQAPRDPRVDDPATAGPAGAQRVDTLEELLQRSDVVSLHCPATPETRHLINAETLAHMPEHAYLVNTARGDVVDEAALAFALKERRIAGAGLDVYEFEPSVTAELRDLENVVLLPHLGSATIETRTNMGMRALRNVDAFVAGAGLPDRVG
ncbi:D-glycerate dehydrogenase [Gemmatimonas sp.]|uniref:2-hydroxyacid dehydrogenase n=2 Tax=Gemmatimonas sp. TaxID=1962908 RepID=UPI0022C4C549|nr:D-glycerate dehydrogenase [Gemmatimonas sp.]MCE2952687.1 D-glycerate dehydrogenase [Gemmatimonas sp.]MCZ8010883.1 D-glycerate dehydrogenase [Gemmatimonas sp.]MCZ8266297.1 D-glycerate dehydrogenase [Gemmatimonas sp.]